jgi:aminoglycoside/choline kinase family phosphotransferase
LPWRYGTTCGNLGPFRCLRIGSLDSRLPPFDSLLRSAEKEVMDLWLLENVTGSTVDNIRQELLEKIINELNNRHV